MPVISYVSFVTITSPVNLDLRVTHFQNPACSTYPNLPKVTYTPAAGFTGSDSFNYMVTDRGDPDGCSQAL